MLSQQFGEDNALRFLTSSLALLILLIYCLRVLEAFVYALARDSQGVFVYNVHTRDHMIKS